jgi:hypothetical protein
MAKRLAGRPPYPITEQVLKRLESYGAAGFSQNKTAAALRMDPGTFIDKVRDYPNFASAWQKGRDAWFDQLAIDAKAVYSGLVKNATLPTPFNPHGQSGAQLGFLGKIMGMDNGGEEAKAQNPTGQETRRIIFEITTDARPGRGTES